MQFVMSALALMVAAGRLDFVKAFYMVAGHTKFGLDLVPRATAGSYNLSYTFNQAILNAHIEKYAMVVPYNCDLL